VTLVAGAGALTATLDTAVNVAFPAISAAFGVPLSGIRWVVVAYILLFAVTLPVAGPLGDRHGHRRIFRLGLALSAVAFLLCGLAPTFGSLLLARTLQGIGAGLVYASAPALVTLAAPGPVQGRSLGLFTFVASAGMAIGPPLAGLALGAWGWPSVYLGRVPLALAVLWLTRPGSAGPSLDEPGARPRNRVEPWLPADLAGRGLAGLALVHGAHLLGQAAIFVIWLLVPYYLVERRGLSTPVAGLLFAAATLAWTLASPLGGWLVDRRARWPAPAGLLVLAAGLAATSRLDAGSSRLAIASALAVAGAGMGLFVVPNMREAMAALPRGRQGLAGSLVMVMRNGGVMAGVLAASALHEVRLRAGLARGLPAEAAATAAFGDTVLGMALVAVLGAGLAVGGAPWGRGHPPAGFGVRSWRMTTPGRPAAPSPEP
jgi:predicted MFS family arabinose efflux permease